MMCLTFKTSTAYCMTERQLRSVWTTTLATLRWTNISPGERLTNCVEGTRETEHPIHRYSGVWCRASSRKNPGSRALISPAHARFRSKSRFSVLMWRHDTGAGALAEGRRPGRGLRSADDFALLHHERDAAQRRDVRERVAGRGDEVGVEAGLDGAALALDAEQPRRVRRHHAQDVGRGDAGLRVRVEVGERERAARLAGDGEEGVGAVGHRHAGA